MSILNATKLAEKRGSGHGADYLPWIETSEFGSIGTCSNTINPKNGRTMELLSQGELYLYYILLWDDNIIDIREQFPLSLPETIAIAKDFSFHHPWKTMTRNNVKKSEISIMTTDFLINYSDGHMEAYSVKSDKTSAKVKTAMEHLAIEKKYWQNHGVPWHLILKDSINVRLSWNIRDVMEYYEEDRVHDPISKIKHLIAIKQLHVDMEKPINYISLSETSLKESSHEGNQ